MFSLPPPPNAVFLLPAATDQYFVFLSATLLLLGSLLLPATPSVSDEPTSVALLLSFCVALHTHSAVAASVHMRRIDHQCPRGWWGSPTCGPCDCDTDKGFDPNCNKTNGHCHCKVSRKHAHTRARCH